MISKIRMFDVIRKKKLMFFISAVIVVLVAILFVNNQNQRIKNESVEKSKMMDVYFSNMHKLLDIEQKAETIGLDSSDYKKLRELIKENTIIKIKLDLRYEPWETQGLHEIK